MPWGPEAFARATAEDKPILLSISAVWCHWCHVMDETSYSDAAVIETINRRYVPVRVDNDRRPDVNARYNMGGWPTTAFLAADGATLTGATYIPPAQMRRALDEVADFYVAHKNEIPQRVAAGDRVAGRTPPSPELGDAAIERFVEARSREFDDLYGGFGDEPKFPQPELLEFLVARWRLTGDRRAYEMAARTITAMGRGGMYDHVEGGFFRYSTTRDWSVPHFEKMAEDHAGLIRVLAWLVLLAPTPEFHATLASALRYVRTVLYDPQGGFFAGSQDADEVYYALPQEERRAREAPYVDRTSYTNWTCALAGAQCLAARALEDDEALAQALRTLDNVNARLLDTNGLVYHVLEPGVAPDVGGLLADQVAYLGALLDAHEVSGEERFLRRAGAIAGGVLAHFAAEDSGFYDRLPSDDALGRLALRDRPIGDNGLLAEALLRLAALTGQSEYRAQALGVLQLFAATLDGAGAFAASYARALQRYLAPDMSLRIVGDAAQTDAFREAALRLPSPCAIRTVAPAEAPGLGLPFDPHPAAYLCIGTTCAAPVRDAADLRDAYDSLGSDRAPQGRT